MLQRPDEIAEDLEQRRKKMERTEDTRKQRERGEEKRESREENGMNWLVSRDWITFFYFSNIGGFVRLGTSGEKRSGEKRKEKDELEESKGKREKRAGMIRVLVHI